MDRDIYLILIGAGISLASSIITLVMKFILDLIGEKIRSNREEKEQQVRDIRMAIMDRSAPTRVGSRGLLKRILPGPDDLDIPTFLRGKKYEGSSPSLRHPEYILAIAVGIIVFLTWVYVVLVRY